MSKNILNPFTNDYNLEIHGRQIAKELNLPQRTVQNKLNELENKKILKSKIVGRNKIFKLNLQGVTFKYIEIAEIEKAVSLMNKHFLITEINEKISKFNEIFLIFGSYANQMENKNSDIDIAYIGDEDTKELTKCFEFFPKKIHFIQIHPEDFLKDINKPFIKEIISNHVILNGTNKFIKLQKNTMVL